MSTKFGKRIPPRKRPWICKSLARSICNPPPSKTLTATFKLKRQTIPPPEPVYYGSLLLHQLGATNEYNGVWRDGTNTYTLFFWFPTTDPSEQPQAGWDLGFTHDAGVYPWFPSALPFPFRYYAATIQTWPDYWFSALLVTG